MPLGLRIDTHLQYALAFRGILLIVHDIPRKRRMYISKLKGEVNKHILENTGETGQILHAPAFSFFSLCQKTQQSQFLSHSGSLHFNEPLFSIRKKKANVCTRNPPAVAIVPQTHTWSTRRGLVCSTQDLEKTLYEVFY